MKYHKTITIDADIEDRLSRIENASSLINTLLRDYFNVRGEKHTFFDQKRAVISDLKKNLNHITKKSKLLLILKNLISTILQSIGLKGHGSTKIRNQNLKTSENIQKIEES